MSRSGSLHLRKLDAYRRHVFADVEVALVYCY
jgi:hypothetical protein